MIVHKSKKGESKLDKWNLKIAEDLRVEWCAYWYSTGCYEGWGYILMRKLGLWYVHNLDHCSCFGPMEKCNLREGFKTIQFMKDNGSEAFNEDMKELFEIAEKNKEEWR